ncbi:MAG TPA: metallophosphoesterase [Prolixibacteraceae bacterium]|nr:metallophosphoesterase [Prolixibacteraceae bacterium]
MNRRRFIKKLGAGAAGLTLGALPQQVFAKDDFVTITILHTNDIHSHVEPFSGNSKYDGKGGLAQISEIANYYRQKNPHTLLFDAGDMFQGTPYFNYFEGELVLKLMSAAGYNAGTIGNHEFDNGLEGIQKALPNAEFPLVISNYDFSNTILADRFPAWKIFDRSGIKIGVYGLGIELEGLVGKKNYGETIYMDPVKTAQRMEKFLKHDKNCDLVVCLSHLGLKYNEDKLSDLTLAPETSFTDLIIGGHTHTFLEEPMRIRNKRNNEVLVNQAWWGGLVIGKIDFVFERARKRVLG